MKGKAFLYRLAETIERSRDYDQYDAEKCIYGRALQAAGEEHSMHISRAPKLEELLGGRASHFHESVCSVDSWPGQFYTAWHAAKSKKAKARVAAERTRYYGRNGQ